MPTYKTVLYDNPAPSVARITMNRPQQRNAQDLQLTYDLNAAFDHAAQDDEVKVIILAGSDPHFSSGHDMRGGSGKTHADSPVVGTWGGFGQRAPKATWRTRRDLPSGCVAAGAHPKPTIAQVQGKCIAGGLMLAWVCDLIIASDDAAFQDPVVGFGVCGVEFFAHPWELGIRKAKEMLFTSDWVSAEEARQLGMVNQVVPRAELAGYTLEMAKKIASKPSFALKLTKEACNQTLEAQGQWTAMLSVFNLHQLAHSHNQELYGMRIDPNGIPEAVRR
jgi:enoyl-CoA hydratase